MLIFHRHELLKGFLPYYTIWIFVFNTTNAIKVQGKLPDLSLMSKLFNMIVKPYLKTNNPEHTFRAFKETAVEKVVRQKVEDLAPFLQDNDVDAPELNNRFTFDGDDETTIIEFIPQKTNESKTILRSGNDTFKVNMQRYKKIRNKIGRALEKELVSEKTKRFVMKSLDELMSKIIETQCNWQRTANFDTQNSNGRIFPPRKILNTWSKVWQNFKSKFSSLTNQRTNFQLKGLGSLMTYLNSMNTIINDVSNNLEKFSKRYRISCNVYEKKYAKNAHNSDALRDLKLTDHTYINQNACNNVRICSEDLKKFLIEFYNSLNDTAVNVLRNYGEMFTRDVNTDDSNEKETIVSKIFNIADVVEKGIREIFTNHTIQLTLDKNKNAKVNINLLSEYIRNVTKHVKVEFGNIMEMQLRDAAPKKVYLNILEDVVVNLGVDLGNLETDMISKICLSLSGCNVNSKRKRFNDIGKETDKDNENKMYIKVELTLDDGFRRHENEIKSISRSTPSSFQNNSSYNVKIITRRVATRLFNYDKYANITVTRTTQVKFPLKVQNKTLNTKSVPFNVIQK